MQKEILKMQGITKYIYDSSGKAIRNTNVKILEGVNFDLREGEVHILVGENGAGKSTLMKVIGGLIPPEEGSYQINGEDVHFQNAQDAKDHGIGFIHQELNLCPNIDIAHNIFLGKEPVQCGYMDKKAMYAKTTELLSSIGFDISPKTLVRDLSTAQQQLVEIVKAISYKSRILIMDEPTASLTKKEIDILFHLIHEMKKEKISIIYISHRFDELVEIGDRITVLRDGKSVGSLDIKDFDRDRLVHMMVGRTMGKMYTFTHKPERQVVLELKNFKIADHTPPFGMTIKKGEIVGLGGLVGSGRTEIAKSVFGARKFSQGEILYLNQPVETPKPSKMVKKGLVYLSEDRKVEGLVLGMNIRENVTVASLGRLFKNKFINRKKEQQVVCEKISDLSINCRSMNQLVDTLSGGNQQRVVFAKWLTAEPKLLILDEPTRGIDVNAKAEIYRLIDQIAKEGVAVLMISSELPELIGMSDRIYVMRNGTISGEITNKEEMTQEAILELTI